MSKAFLALVKHHYALRTSLVVNIHCLSSLGLLGWVRLQRQPLSEYHGLVTLATRLRTLKIGFTMREDLKPEFDATVRDIVRNNLSTLEVIKLPDPCRDAALS